MDIYYKVPKDSETGRKFSTIRKKLKKCREASLAFIEKYGFESYRPRRISVDGGISSCCKPKEELPEKIWKRNHQHGEFMPKLNTTEGRAIQEEMNKLPYVGKDELNAIVGYPGNGLNNTCIGFSVKNPDYYGFSTSDKWECNIPMDCIEITYSEYKRLFLHAWEGKQ